MSAAPATEAARRKNVQDAIDRVLFKVGSWARGALRLRGTAPHLPAPRPCPQINELEAILGEFDGQNELLHAKL